MHKKHKIAYIFGKQFLIIELVLNLRFYFIDTLVKIYNERIISKEFCEIKILP